MTRSILLLSLILFSGCIFAQKPYAYIYNFDGSEVKSYIELRNAINQGEFTQPIDSITNPEKTIPESLPLGTYVMEEIHNQKLNLGLFNKSNIKRIYATPDGKGGFYLQFDSPDRLRKVESKFKSLEEILPNVFHLPKSLRTGLVTAYTDKEKTLWSVLHTKRKPKYWHYFSPEQIERREVRKIKRSNIDQGYMAFNKPKYRYGDSLKLKIFALDKKFRPIEDSISILFHEKWIDLGPIRPGLFTFETVISDSLLLDQSYSVTAFGDKNLFLSETFKVEDYELKSYDYALKMSKTIFFSQGEEVNAIITGNDQNNNPAYGTRAEIKVSLSHPAERPDTFAYFPKLIYELDTTLSNKENVITIPASSILPIGANYELSLRLTAPNGEVKNRSRRFLVYPNKEKPVSHKAKEQVLLTTWRKHDSIHVRVFNPDSQFYAFKVFENNSLHKVIEGTEEKEIIFHSDPYKLYTVKNTNYQTFHLPPSINYLRIELDQPKKIIPGETFTATVKVKDHMGNPVPGVDLTAFGVNAKFEGRGVSKVPYLGKSYKGKTPSYTLTTNSPKVSIENKAAYRSDVARFRLLDSLDYQIRYADDLLMKYRPIADSFRAWVSPFLTDGNLGQLKQVLFIYINKQLVYDGESVGKSDFAFQHYPGKFQIKWRTRENVYILDSVELKKGQHLFLSLDVNKLPAKARVISASSRLTKEEVRVRERGSLKFNPQNLIKGDYFSGSNKSYQIPSSFLKYNYKKEKFLRIGPFLKTEVDFIRPGIFGLHITGTDGIIDIKKNGIKFTDVKEESLNSIPKYIAPPDISRSITEIDLNKLTLPTYAFRGIELNQNADDNSSIIFHPGYKACFVARIGDENNWYPHVTQNSTGPWLLPGRYNFIFLTMGDSIVRENDIEIKGGQHYYFPKKKAELPTDDRWSRMARKKVMVNKEYDQTYFLNSTLMNGDKKLHVQLGIAVAFMDEILLFKEGKLVQGKLINSFAIDFENLNPGKYQVVAMGEKYFGFHELWLRSDTTLKMEYGEATWLVDEEVKYGFYPKAYSLNPTLINSSMLSVSLPDFIPNLFYRNQNRNTNRVIFRWKDYKPQRADSAINGMGWIEGRIIDESGNPIEGAAIMIRLDRSKFILPGARVGTYSREEGWFKFLAPTTTKSLFINHIGYEHREVELSEDLYNIRLETYRQGLDEVVITGYSARNISTLAGRTAGIFSRGSYSIRQKKMDKPSSPIFGLESNLQNSLMDANKSETSGEEQAIYQQIRNNFRDAAYWVPDLLTDENGEATFTVKMPDDITSWDTYVLAMNGSRQSGQTQANIQAFAPISTQLEVPRFLIEGDSSEVIAMVMNYEADSSSAEVRFGQEKGKNIELNDYYTERRKIVALGDSLSLQYSVSLPNGYQDGERRRIEVKPRGMIEREGEFHRLDGFSSITVPAAPNQYISIYASPVHRLQEDIESLKTYPHSCTEQLLSKLVALDAEKKLKEKVGLKFKENAQIKKIKKQIKKRGNYGFDYLRWWDEGESTPWLSAYAYQVMNRLAIDKDERFCQQQGNILWNHLQYRFDISAEEWLWISIALLENSDYLSPAWVEEELAKKEKESAFNTPFLKLEALRMKQLAKLPLSQKDILELGNKSTLGNYYWGTQTWSWYGGDVEASCLAYQMLKEMKADTSILNSIRDYLLLERSAAYGHNTREAALLIHTFLPEWDAQSWSDTLAISIETKKGSRIIKDFPKIIPLSDAAEITKKGHDPAYVSVFREEWNPNPQRLDSIFKLTSSIYKDGKQAPSLKKGESYQFLVEVDAASFANFIALTIPIPAGCTFSEKIPAAGELHREYYKDRVVIYLENMDKGKHSFVVPLLSRFGGNYSLNPVQVEMMYMPQFRGNNEIKQLSIE
ncbi:MAG: hypothetical protein MRZ79_12890 [Bacteroidia bacterium]|nr:hypothetical protein [Bacteroidia bacterium]